MPLPRSATVVPGQSGFYHCLNRCVRRSFLCGKDKQTGIDYEHRRQWIVDRLFDITRVFAVDVYAYSIMENHYHVVLYIDPDRVKAWSDEEVIVRWSKVFAWRRGNKKPSKLPYKPSKKTVDTWRERLGSISWMMQSVNEPIARWANKEDDVTGHFWEGRFKSLSLLDKAGLLSCMSYVDLNPVRAGIAIDPESSDFTSIQRRVHELGNEVHGASRSANDALGPIQSTKKDPIQLDISQSDYIELVRVTVTKELADRPHIQALLSRLGISVNNWYEVVDNMLSLFRTAIGDQSSFEKFIASTCRKRYRDQKGRNKLYA